MPGKMARSDPRPSVRATRGVGSGQHLASVLQEGRENANINALGFIWRVSVKANMHMMMKSFFVATALIAAASSAQAQSYNWNSRRVVVDPPTAAQRAAADEEARREEKARDAAGNTSGASTTASATTQASGGGINGSYSTTFPPDRKSDQRRRIGATGLGWANVQTTPGLPSSPALSTRAPTYTSIRPQFSKVYGRKTSKYKQPSKFAALTAGPAAKK